MQLLVYETYTSRYWLPSTSTMLYMKLASILCFLSIDNILVAKALVVVSNEVECSVIKESTELLSLSLGLGAGDLSGHLDFANSRHL
jgi:hypothetical protein